MPATRRRASTPVAMRATSPRQRVAFTLVEFLVVVGIIAVLIALLMPALAKVRKHAQEVHCAANLRSIGQALTMYVQSYRHYPGCVGVDTGNAYAAVWPTRLRAFTRGERRVFNCPAQDERFWWTDDGPGGDMSVVAGEVEASWFGYEVGERLIVIQGSYFTYGYNMWGTGERGNNLDNGLGTYISASAQRRPFYPGSGPGSRMREIPASRVKRPADMIAVADSIPDTSWDFAIDGPADIGSGIGDPRGWPGTIHRGGANVLFCDGHVRWYLQKELVDYTGPLGPQRRRMWHNDYEP